MDPGVAIGLGLIALVGFFIFVRCDQRRLRKRDHLSDRAVLNDGESRGSSLMPFASLGVALMAGLLAASQWVNPPNARSTGRWSLLWNTLLDALGTYGPALFSSALALVFAIAGSASWRTRRRSAPGKAS